LAVAVSIAVAITSFASTAAMAAQPADANGHYEWRPAPQNGPRIPLQAPVRVWVDASRDQQMEAHRATPDVIAHAQDRSAGRYEWYTPRQVGPRAPIQAPTRIWVPSTPSRA
jgi:hypothetical protein